MKKRIYKIIVAAFCVALVLGLMFGAYRTGKDSGRQLGRAETIQLITEELEIFEFSTDDYVTHGTTYPGEDWSNCIETRFKNNKLSFSYEHH